MWFKICFCFFSRHSWILQRISADNWGSHGSRHLGILPVCDPSGRAGYVYRPQPWAQWLCSTTKQKGADYITENRRVNIKTEGKSKDSKVAKPTQDTLVLSQCCPPPSSHSPSACRVFMGHPQHPTWTSSPKPCSAHVWDQLKREI